MQSVVHGIDGRIIYIDVAPFGFQYVIIYFGFGSLFFLIPEPQLLQNERKEQNNSADIHFNFPVKKKKKIILSKQIYMKEK